MEFPKAEDLFWNRDYHRAIDDNNCSHFLYFYRLWRKFSDRGSHRSERVQQQYHSSGLSKSTRTVRSLNVRIDWAYSQLCQRTSNAVGKVS